MVVCFPSVFPFLKTKAMNRSIILLGFSLAALSCQGSPQTEAMNAEATTLGAETATTDCRTASDDSILANAIYTKADSARVVELLKKDAGDNDVLFYARQFLGVPYVAHTLEMSDPEKLVVNLRELDCTTFVETALALAMTKRQGSVSFADYCRNLTKLRYRGGEMNGYLSRLHYFTWWMHDNLERGNIVEVSDDKHFTATIHVNNHYMSTYPEKYKFLKLHPEWVDSIAAMEQRLNGPDGNYLPEANTALSAQDLSCVRSGDLLGIVTTKKGLDYSHLGFAVWGKDGKLHLLDASSKHRKVVEEAITLRRYLQNQSTSMGVRLFRLK